MSNFSLTFSDGYILLDGEKTLHGYMDINDYRESFYASASYWSSVDYLKHWKAALSDFITGNNDRIGLIINMRDPRLANFIIILVLYRVSSSVLIQNHIVFLDEIDGEFCVGRLAEFIPDRETHSEDGTKISEWEVSINAIKEFDERIKFCGT
jgi:hypothetical protein